MADSKMSTATQVNAKDSSNTEKQKSKIGEGHVNAFFRQGLSELRASLYTGSNIAQPTEYGIYGHQTPGEIADDRKPEQVASQSLDEEPTQAPSPLQQSMKEAESRSQNRSPERGKEQGFDRDR